MAARRGREPRWTAPKDMGAALANKRHRTITRSCGWLGLDGGFYPCDEGGHAALAKEILAAAGPLRAGEHWHLPEVALEERGWLKLIPGGSVFEIGFVADGKCKRGTPRQDRALLEWCLGDGRGQTELPRWLGPDQEPENGAE